MNLLVHQFKKDFRQTWILWALWAFFTILQFALAGVDLRPGESPASRTYAQIAAMVPMLNSLLLLVLIPALLLQEPTVGVSAFWLTRPLPRATVLGSKLIALGLLFLLPVLGQCAVLLAHHVLPGDVALAGLQIALSQLRWITLAAVLAVLSPSFGRFVIVAVVFFTLQYFSDWLFGWITQLHAKPTPATFADSVSFTLPVCRGVVGDLLHILFALGILFFQYLTRRTRISLVLAGVGLLAAAEIPKFWFWDFLRAPESAAVDPELNLSPDSIQIAPGGNHNVYEGNEGGPNTPMQKIVNTTLEVSGLKPKQALFIQSLGGTLTLADGSTIALSSLGSPTFSTTAAVLEEALGNIPFLNVTPFSPLSQSENLNVSLFSLDPAYYASHLETAGKASFTFKCSAIGYHIANEVPLKKGEGFSDGSTRTTITEVRSNSNSVAVGFEVRAVYLRLRPSSYTHGAFSTHYALVNRKRGEAMVLEADRQPFDARSVDSASGFVVGLRTLLPAGEQIENTSAFSLLGKQLDENMGSMRISLHFIVPVDAAWLADATLVRLESQRGKIFEERMELPNFALDGHTLPTWEEVRRRKAMSDALSKIAPLPEHPSRSEAWQYIRAIAGLATPESLRDDDPQIALLQKVGPANADQLLIAMERGFLDWYPVRAFNRLDFKAEPNEVAKKMTFRILAAHPDLIDAILHNGWEKEAEPFILEALGNAKTDFRNLYSQTAPHHRWVQAVASLRDPASYDLLFTWTENRSLDKKQFGSSDFDSNLYRNLRALPGPLVAGSVEKVWKQKRGTDQESSFLGTALEWGLPDALDRTVEILAEPLPADPKEKEKQQNIKNTARNLFNNRTACPGNLLDGALVEWYAANKARLAFDIRLGRFLATRDPAPPGPDEPWQKPEDHMKDLGIRAAWGDLAAVDEMDALLARLSDGIDPAADPKRLENLTNLAWNAAGAIREEARKTPETAFPVLRQMNTKERLRRFVPQGYKMAAADGNDEAVETLLRYEKNGWTLPATIDALWEAVQKGNPKAVDFVAAVLADPAKKKFWNQAGNCLKELANAGNPKAKAAYEAWQKAKSPTD
ncbi:ABC-type transport system involved in multi-copper enzyme maturation, permease component [Verrucomicrobium sp. GAS474]|uniref:hypothetical protein n=1 Tax=Verrucomicrobium sp. GAS474 TaxID=1882831 RepID=UPI00087DE79B|nr:hypothetical protein [Verrucomicrobium sp. GAS474]SDU08348.1 ABC-type transport system involved in multi-copper enzyme maturation, permease component [Verrucomicrobium sp. GAS474]